eukprot:365203-Chlamydomonas_euryale.AAC.2
MCGSVHDVQQAPAHLHQHCPDFSIRPQVENPAAKDALATIQGRLSGTLLGVLSQPSMPLSVQGQAQRLIGEAADKEKLGSMYIWWMPWM